MRLAVAVAIGSIALITACGDNGGRGQDASSGSDAFVSPDAVTCAPGEVETELVNVNGGPTTQVVTLDGMGTRCEQLTRALLDPAVLPPELEPIRAFEIVPACFGSGTDDTVFLTGTGLDGVELLGTQWQIQFGLWDLQLGFWSGFYVPPDRLPGPACLGTTELQRQMPGAELPYIADDPGCFGGTIATYVAQAGDAFAVGDQAYYLDSTALPPVIHRVRAVDVHLLPSHVTPPMLRSSLFCCTDTSLLDCVGMRLEVDTFTREVLSTQTLCDHVCTQEME